jgi:hypothetical protein
MKNGAIWSNECFNNLSVSENTWVRIASSMQTWQAWRCPPFVFKRSAAQVRTLEAMRTQAPFILSARHH